MCILKNHKIIFILQLTADFYAVTALQFLRENSDSKIFMSYEESEITSKITKIFFSIQLQSVK